MSYQLSVVGCRLSVVGLEDLKIVKLNDLKISSCRPGLGFGISVLEFKQFVHLWQKAKSCQLKAMS